MKIVCISDTHNYHNHLKIPKCDLLIHAGDFTKQGLESECIDFIFWLKSLQSITDNIVFIAGNHDFLFQANNNWIQNRLKGTNITYLRDSFTTINDLKIYGTPWTPYFFDWAFNGVDYNQDIIPTNRNPLLSEVYSNIPTDTDILICHSPPKGILDVVTRTNENVGSIAIKSVIEQKLTNLKYYICGHIHESRGTYVDTSRQPNITYVNASVINDKLANSLNSPIEIEI